MSWRVAVLASGSGTNLQALVDNPEVGPAVALVISDRAEAGVLRRAAGRNIEALHLDPSEFAGREEHDAALVDLLSQRAVDLVCLAGYMRILSPVAVRAYWGRILNVHPSLLPAFPGANAVRDALEWGVKVTGCTVHLVDEEVDHGPILAQEAVTIRPGDDEASLHARIKEVEHRLYPAAVRAALEGRVLIEDRTVSVAPEED